MYWTITETVVGRGLENSMATEIERKFLVHGERWREKGTPTKIRQGFFLSVNDRGVRIRIKGDEAFITMKSEAHGFTRHEFEYKIPMTDAKEMLDTLCERPLVEKTRYALYHAGKRWVVDEFHGDNDGLIMAEVELESEMETIERPDWAGMEVTDNPRYYNIYLARHPFNTWYLNPKSPTGKEHLINAAHAEAAFTSNGTT